MGDPISALLAVASLVGAGTQVQQQRRAEREAEQAGRRQARQAEALAAEVAERGAREETEEAVAGARAAQRARQRALAATGRRATILTGPLGLTEGLEGGQRTLLGL